MPKIRLSTAGIKTLPVPKSRIRYFDSACRGLVLVCYPSGTKSFAFSYRPPGRAHGARQASGATRITLGRFPEMTLDHARRLAMEHQIRLTDGDDPRRSGPDPATVTLEDGAQAYLDDFADKVARGERSARTLADIAATLEKYVFPFKIDGLALRRWPVAALSRGDIKALIAHIERDVEKRTGRSGRRTAGLALTYLRAMLNRLELDEPPLGQVLPPGSNPAARITVYQSPPRKRIASHDELARLVGSMRRAWQDGSINAYALLLFALCLITGARRGELQNARRIFIDLGSMGAVLPLAETKTGPRELFLPPAAVRLIEANPAPRAEDGKEPWLIPGRPPTRPMREPKAAWAKLLAAADIQGFNIHDLRRQFVSTGLQSGVNLQRIGALVGHSRTETTNRYAWLERDASAQLAHQIGEKLGAELIV